MINKKQLHLSFITATNEAREEAESVFFNQYKSGLITSLELANQILILHEQEKQILKDIKKIFNE